MNSSYIFKILALLLVYVINSAFHLLNAQAPSVQWQQSLGGSYYDEAFSVIQTSDSNFVMAGYAGSSDGDVSGNHGGEDYWIVKMDQSGNLIWEKSFGGTLNEWPWEILETFDHDLIVAGYASGNGGDVTGNNGWYDYWIVKLNSSGDLLWEKCFGGSSGDIANCIQQTNDGGYIVAGESASDDSDVTGNHKTYLYNYYCYCGDTITTEDFWITRLDSEANIVWQKSLGGSGTDEAQSVSQTADGGFIIAGYTLSHDGDVTGNHGASDYWIVKLDANGNLIWQKNYGGSLYDYAYEIKQTPDGGYVVAGSSSSNDGDVTGNHGADDYWIMKLDSSGNLQWEKSLGGSNYDDAYSIQIMNNNHYIIAGKSISHDGDVTGYHTSDDFWIVELDTLGNVLWEKCFGGSSHDIAYSIQQTFDGGFIAGGCSSSTNGDVTGNHGLLDFWIVKLSASGATSISSAERYLISVFPNPVVNFLTINLPISSNDFAIHIYDCEGEEAWEISNFKSQTSNSIQLNTENLPAGFYTLQIINNKTGESKVGKFVKQ